MSRSSIIEPDVYSYKDPNPIMVYGEALASNGLETRQAVNGYGLLSRGLLWQLYDIWADIETLAPITTTWSNVSGASITTTWTASQFGVFGEYPT